MACHVPRLSNLKGDHRWSISVRGDTDFLESEHSDRQEFPRGEPAEQEEAEAGDDRAALVRHHQVVPDDADLVHTVPAADATRKRSGGQSPTSRVCLTDGGVKQPEPHSRKRRPPPAPGRCRPRLPSSRQTSRRTKSTCDCSRAGFLPAPTESELLEQRPGIVAQRSLKPGSVSMPRADSLGSDGATGDGNPCDGWAVSQL